MCRQLFVAAHLINKREETEIVRSLAVTSLLVLRINYFKVVMLIHFLGNRKMIKRK